MQRRNWTLVPLSLQEKSEKKDEDRRLSELKGILDKYHQSFLLRSKKPIDSECLKFLECVAKESRATSPATLESLHTRIMDCPHHAACRDLSSAYAKKAMQLIDNQSLNGYVPYVEPPGCRTTRNKMRASKNMNAKWLGVSEETDQSARDNLSELAGVIDAYKTLMGSNKPRDIDPACVQLIVCMVQAIADTTPGTLPTLYDRIMDCPRNAACADVPGRYAQRARDLMKAIQNHIQNTQTQAHVLGRQRVHCSTSCCTSICLLMQGALAALLLSAGLGAAYIELSPAYHKSAVQAQIQNDPKTKANRANSERLLEEFAKSCQSLLLAHTAKDQLFSLNSLTTHTDAERRPYSGGLSNMVSILTSKHAAGNFSFIMGANDKCYNLKLNGEPAAKETLTRALGYQTMDYLTKALTMAALPLPGEISDFHRLQLHELRTQVLQGRPIERYQGNDVSTKATKGENIETPSTQVTIQDGKASESCEGNLEVKETVVQLQDQHPMALITGKYYDGLVQQIVDAFKAGKVCEMQSACNTFVHAKKRFQPGHVEIVSVLTYEEKDDVECFLAQVARKIDLKQDIEGDLKKLAGFPYNYGAAVDYSKKLAQVQTMQASVTTVVASYFVFAGLAKQLSDWSPSHWLPNLTTAASLSTTAASAVTTAVTTAATPAASAATTTAHPATSAAVGVARELSPET